MLCNGAYDGAIPDRKSPKEEQRNERFKRYR